MHVRLVLLISSFGLVMGVGSVAGFINMSQEGTAWIVLGLVAATCIALRAPERPFLHGLIGGIVAGSIAPIIQILFYSSYVAHNPSAAAAFSRLPTDASPRLFVFIVTPILGVLTGVTLGSLAWIEAKALRRKVTAGF